MSSLLVQSCSKSKHETLEAVSALELYDGYFFKIIKKAKREGVFSNSIDICILSAEHGIIDSKEKIAHYDRKMDSERAKELKPAVQKALKRRAQEGYETIYINAGQTYRKALDGIAQSIDPTVYYIEGDGIGYKGSILKDLVRGNSNPTTETALSPASD